MDEEIKEYGRCQITFYKSVQVMAEVRRVPGGFEFKPDGQEWSFVPHDKVSLVNGQKVQRQN